VEVFRLFYSQWKKIHARLADIMPELHPRPAPLDWHGRGRIYFRHFLSGPKTLLFAKIADVRQGVVIAGSVYRVYAC